MKDEVALLEVHRADAGVLQGFGGALTDRFALDELKHRRIP